VLRGFLPMRKYMWQWFDPESGDWEEAVMLETTKKGNLTVPDFPDRGDRIFNDWAAKIILE